jgi:hypothetical protein
MGVNKNTPKPVIFFALLSLGMANDRESQTGKSYDTTATAHNSRVSILTQALSNMNPLVKAFLDSASNRTNRQNRYTDLDGAGPLKVAARRGLRFGTARPIQSCHSDRGTRF